MCTNTILNRVFIFQVTGKLAINCSYLKIYSHKTKKFLLFIFFLILMFTSLFIKAQHLHIISKIEAVFQLFLSLHICCTISEILLILAMF